MSVCAVDIGGTFTKIALVDERGAVQNFQRIPTTAPIENYICELIRGIEIALQKQPARAIGVSLAGFIDAAHNRLIYNPNLPWLEHFPLQAALSQKFAAPVVIEVDSNAAALAEYRFGHGAGADRFLCLTIGTGIGGGFLTNGELVRLTHECIGDVGHVIVEPGGRRCTCGGLGCAEAEATAPAILAKSGSQATSLEELLQASASELLFSEAGRYLGLLCASLASIFFPDCIALCGGVCEASPLVTHAAQIEFERSASDFARAHVRIVGAKLGSNASLVGAGSLFSGT
jgi:glucokinase